MLESALMTFTSVLFVVDPWGTIPAFLVMTQGDPPDKRRQTAAKASLVAFFVLSLFALAGSHLLQVFGISMPAFRIAGGLILLIVALEMIHARRSSHEAPDEVEEGRVKDDVAVTPLAIPMLAGPASLSTVTLLVSRAESWQEVAVVHLSIALTMLVTMVSLVLGAGMYRWFGTTGIHVLSRILGVLLAAIAVQFLIDGLRESGLVPHGTTP